MFANKDKFKSQKQLKHGVFNSQVNTGRDINNNHDEDYQINIANSFVESELGNIEMNQVSTNMSRL